MCASRQINPSKVLSVEGAMIDALVNVAVFRWVSALSGSVRGRISELIERVTVRGPMQSFKSASQELIHKIC
jgi:hypothetical protein